jgi:hypothetical protein
LPFFSPGDSAAIARIYTKAPGKVLD